MKPEIYLDVPFDEKNEAKKMGARWEPGKKKWYIFDNNKYKTQMMGRRFNSQRRKHLDFRNNIKWEHYYFNECWTILNRNHTQLILDDVNFTFFENFPSASVKISNLLILDPISNNQDTLLFTKRAYVELSLINIFHKKYGVEKGTLELLWTEITIKLSRNLTL